MPLHEYYRQEGEPQPVDGEDCLAERDRRYISWAAFLDFLIERYGMEKLLELLGPVQPPEQVPTPPPILTIPPHPSGTPTIFAEPAVEVSIIQPPDYEGVYGLALNQLEDAWLRQLTEKE